MPAPEALCFFDTLSLTMYVSLSTGRSHYAWVRRVERGWKTPAAGEQVLLKSDTLGREDQHPTSHTQPPNEPRRPPHPHHCLLHIHLRRPRRRTCLRWFN